MSIGVILLTECYLGTNVLQPLARPRKDVSGDNRISVL